MEAAAGPDWASVMTAIGTVAVAVVAAGVTLFGTGGTRGILA
jgi:hypothetical protein